MLLGPRKSVKPLDSAPPLQPFCGRSMKLKLTLVLALGILMGSAFSALASASAFPHDKFLVEFVHNASSRANYVCTRRGSALGQNLSSYDFAKDAQTNCILLLVGAARIDGSFDAYLGTTWYERLANASSPVNIPATQIKSVRKADF
jgi:hypothetical protein